MAEALGLGASIIAVLQISGSLIKTCKQYIEAVQDYPGDLRVILIETSSLKSLLETLQFLEKCGTSPMPTALAGPVQGCHETLSALVELLPVACDGEQDAPKKRSLAASLAWPLRQTKARKLLDQLMRHKTSINAAISTESWQDTKAIKRDVESLKHSLSESEKYKIRDWLEQVNPSSNHNKAVELYESGTGEWVLRTTSWNDWINCKSQGLWIHGIPGAGKTILAAHLVEVIDGICKKEQSYGRRCASIYYYCLHSRNHCEALPFLRWLLSELCRQCGGISQLMEQLYANSREPTIKQLLLCLESILADFETVFVVIDALDESQPRQALLSLARELVTDIRFNKLQILATSREYHDIEQMVSSAFVSMPMSNSFVENDIKHCISAKIKATPHFQKWPHTLQGEVEEALSRGAKGMFRWAVCQLDILRRIPTVRGIRAALKDLPKDLDDTYQRIFSYIGEGEKELVRHALRWLSFHSLVWAHKPVRPSPQILWDSYILSTTESTFVPAEDEEHWCDIENLKDSCGCLVTFDAWGASFAHYTVREFIESPRATSGYAEFFSSNFGEYSDFLALLLFSEAAIRGISVDCQSIDDDTFEHLMSTNISFYRLASGLQIILDEVPVKIEEQDLVHYLDARKPHFNYLCETSVAMHDGDWVGSFYLPEILDPKPIFDSAMLSLIWMRRFDLAARLLSKTEVSRQVEIRSTFRLPDFDWWGKIGDHQWRLTPFEPTCSLIELVAITPQCNKEQLRALEFVSQRGFELNDMTILLRGFVTWHHMCEGAGLDDPCSLREVLSKGADPNGRGFRVTPLQIAVIQQNLEAIEALLEFGAKVNWTGESGGSIGCDPFDHLHGRTPLQIIRRMRIQHNDKIKAFEKVEESEKFEEIEQIILEHGGEDNSTAGADNIFGPHYW